MLKVGIILNKNQCIFIRILTWNCVFLTLRTDK